MASLTSLLGVTLNYTIYSLCSFCFTRDSIQLSIRGQSSSIKSLHIPLTNHGRLVISFYKSQQKLVFQLTKLAGEGDEEERGGEKENEERKIDALSIPKG